MAGSGTATETQSQMTPRAVHRFALLTAAATLGLLGVGGLVTSHGVGMAVPDWPNTYGYNLFFFPVSQWVGGIFYEHSHRLVASGVGLMTCILALWLHGTHSRPLLRYGGWLLMFIGAGTLAGMPQRWADAVVLGVTGLAATAASRLWPRCEPGPKWLRRLGVAAFVLVVLQGVLGGLRVVLLKDEIGILHATLAQLFFVVICALALFTSRWWQEAGVTRMGNCGEGVRVTGGTAALLVATTVTIFGQLVLGATMRHQHAGLAIPDFPLAYGRIWPATDPKSVAQYNQRRLEVTAVGPITAGQVTLQMVHRVTALAIVVGVGLLAWRVRRELGFRHAVSKLALVWLGLISGQVLLGAATIWSDKAADIATGHVVMGALALALGAVVCLTALRPLPARVVRRWGWDADGAATASRLAAPAVPGMRVN